MKISRKQAAYPTLLDEINSPPANLYYKGDAELLHKTCVSIVGTRRNTEYGSILTEKIIAEIAHLDLVIVSGLAYGIDTIAHIAALEYNIPTIAVLACGIDDVYPKSNTALAQEISKKGLIISEYPGHTSPRKHHFPLRNRIISGLSILTIVVEAPEKSGALITARYALEQGRDIATIPADVDRQSSWGNLKLLQEGAAYPIASGQDVIGLLQKQPSIFTKPTQQVQSKLSPKEQLILDSLTQFRALSISEISDKNKFPIQEILVTLSMLEMYGLAKNAGGKYLSTLQY